MRCLVVTPHRYGIRETAERVGQQWEALGHTVEYVLADGAAATVGPVTVGTLGIAGWWYRTLRRIADGADGYDLIWLHQPLAPLLPTADPDFWRRVVVTFHTTMRSEYRLARDGIYPARLAPFHWLTKTIEARFYRALAASGGDPTYTVVAPHLRDEIGEFGVEDAAYVPNGICAPGTDHAGPIRSDYGIPADATLVFNVGKMLPQKRPVAFARVAREITDRDPDVHVVMAGKGPLLEEVRTYASDRFHVPGYVAETEKWRWFADADVFASLSAYEGMPVALCEALSQGLPLVLSDIPAHDHLIGAHDATGELVVPDADAVLAAVRRMDDRRSDVSLPGWEDVAASYLDLVRTTPVTPT